MLKRSGWITGAMVIQCLWALGLFAISVYLLILTRGSAIQTGKDAAGAVSGLQIAAAILFAPAALAAASWYGLRKEKRWGWWLAVLGNLGFLGMLIYSMVDDGWRNIDWSVAVFAAAAAVGPIILLLPGVRRFYWRGAGFEAIPHADASRTH